MICVMLDWKERIFDLSIANAPYGMTSITMLNMYWCLMIESFVDALELKIYYSTQFKKGDKVNYKYHVVIKE